MSVSEGGGDHVGDRRFGAMVVSVPVSVSWSEIEIDPTQRSLHDLYL